MSDPVRVEIRGRVMEITLDRPPVNAINQELSDQLYGALCRLRDDDDLRVGIVTGGGEKCFSAGWDLKAAAAAIEAGRDAEEEGATPGGWAGITEFFDLYKPLIAAVNGHAVGGGFEVALACDLIVAAEHAEFWLPDMNHGFLPDAGAVQRLPRRVPYNVAVDLIWTGRHMSAEEAKHWGLVSDVLPAEELMAHARALADQIAGGPPLAVQALKEALPILEPLTLPDTFRRVRRGQTGMPIYERMLDSDDLKEGPKAFAEKRKSDFKGA